MRDATVAGVAAIDRTNRKPLLAAFLAIALMIGLWNPLEARASSDYQQVVDMTFPLAEGTYSPVTDTYDDWRDKSVGRRHQAADIMADYGTPVYAAVGGTISGVTGVSGCERQRWLGTQDNPPSYGYAIYIAADDGREYSYLHFGRDDGPASEAYAGDLDCGMRIERGQLLGYAGHSGNANSAWPHLHLSIADPNVTDPYDYYDHERLNPYPSLKDAERRGDFPGFEPIDLTSDATPIAGDWDGDGHVTPGWFDRGRVHQRSRSGAVRSFGYGKKGDLPVVGDWNGDGVDTMGIVRDGRWHLRFTNDAGVADLEFKYGRILKGDYPLAGDWNGNGKDTVGIVRGGEWHLRNKNSGGPGQIVYTYGRVRHGDVPVTGDWTRDGRDTPGIVRGREWHLRNVHRGGRADTVFKYGASGDVPVVGDWNASGTDTPGIVRGREWHLRNRNSGGGAHITLDF